MPRRERNSTQGESQPYFMRAFSGVNSPHAEAFYASLLSPSGPLAAGPSGRAALEAHIPPPRREHPYTARVLPHLYMDSTSMEDKLHSQEPPNGPHERGGKPPHTSYASAAVAGALQIQSIVISKGSLAQTWSPTDKVNRQLYNPSPTPSVAPPDLPAHLRPAAAARLQGCSNDQGAMSYSGTRAEDDMQSLASNLHSQLGLGDLESAHPTQGNNEECHLEQPLCSHSALILSLQPRTVTAGPLQYSTVDESLEHQLGQNFQSIDPFNDACTQDELAKSCPLGELSTNILNFKADSASSMQQACTEGVQKKSTLAHAPPSHQIAENSTKLIDNLVYDTSHLDESVAIRLSSTGSSGSTDWFGASCPGDKGITWASSEDKDPDGAHSKVGAHGGATSNSDRLKGQNWTSELRHFRHSFAPIPPLPLPPGSTISARSPSRPESKGNTMH
eukprot:jgi/Botrbrau1/13204/Bobra.0351s0015.1